MKKILQDRKTLYLVLTIVMISIFALSIAYAALSTVLEISGNTHISSAEWDIYLSNPRVTSGSVSSNAPQISGTSTLSFDTELNTPGDFYEFTVDVVNGGSIDAMIDSVVKTPELTSEQAKYIKYEITYENGNNISANQILNKNTTTPIKVRVEYRKDIVALDLPSTSTELSLKLTLVYIQSDGNGSDSSNSDSSSGVRVISGDGTKTGNEVCIKEECFYVISSTDSSVTMLSKYNLHVGNSVDENENKTPLSNPTGIQDEAAGGLKLDEHYNPYDYPMIGSTAFSNASPIYSGSIIEGYVNNYENYLITQGVTPLESRLISKEELVYLGCENDEWTCTEAPNWVYSTSYWSNHIFDGEGDYLLAVIVYGGYDAAHYDDSLSFGVRPVITISRDYL